MSESSEDERIILTINDVKYDVTDYAPVHPGEGMPPPCLLPSLSLTRCLSSSGHNDIYIEDYGE